MIEKILPLLNRVIPTGLAFKGIQKLNPRIGKFLQGAAIGGYTADQALDYLRDKFQTNKNEEAGRGLRPDEKAVNRQVENSKQLPNMLSSAATLGGGVAGGLGASAIGSLFQNEENNPQIPEQQIPSEQRRTQALKKFNEIKKQKKPGIREDLQQKFDQGYGQQQEPQNADQALLTALAKILEM